ncbi:MAG: nucleoside monophosphate kinase [Pirellulales bacterium]|nr:nucleoside monophosphate kinase [Pirellulales bacterium]
MERQLLQGYPVDQRSLPAGGGDMCGRESREFWFHPAHQGCGEASGGRAESIRLVLIGPPGVGKGTQAALLCRRYQACHLSTGDLFRAAACESELSAAMQAALVAMRRGELVSDELVMDLVRERCTCLACQGGFLLDGVPRTLPQARALVELLAELEATLDGVVLYELAETEIVARICGRRTCATCKAVYHESACPPAKPGACDRCGGSLMQRDDDRPEVVVARLAAYRAATRPLSDFYAARGELIPVAAHGSPEEICERTCQALAARRTAPRC